MRRIARRDPPVEPEVGGEAMTEWNPLAEKPVVRLCASARWLLSRSRKVRLWPAGRADIMDLALEGKTATVEAIEEDLEGRIYLAVTVDDDPGREPRQGEKAGAPFLLRRGGNRAA